MQLKHGWSHNHVTEIIKSKAWSDLRGNAAKLLVTLMYYVEDHDQPFTFTFDEAQVYGFYPSTFRRSMDELISSGFIEVVSRDRLQSADRYRFSSKWKTAETQYV